ncbi:G5 domain-containing protein [Candidatus Saccharibacteria bacterium]|nr:G5 domain-containing protein [Candidatus Saccharibacteria bacterium]
MRDFTNTTSPLFILLLCLSVAFGIFSAIVMPKVQAVGAGERLIMIHDRDAEQGLMTRAATLRDVFEEANIRLDHNDRVEPGLDEPLVATHYQVNIYRARPVVIVDGAVKQLVMSAYQTPKQIAKHAGIELHDEDTANVDISNDFISDGASLRMNIDRALPIELTLYGKTETVYTQSATVGEFLSEKDISLGKDDDVSLGDNVAITANMKLSIWRNGKQTITQEEDVAFETEKIQDANREVGYKKIDSPGVNGKKMVTYEIVMQNGIEVSRTAIQTVVTKEPTKQVETVGTKSTSTFSGSFGEALARLQSCEGSYTSNTGNRYYGAYQFDIQTWGGYGGFPHAAAAPPAVQDEKAWLTYQRRGWQPWPSCTKKMGLQDIYR